METLLNPKSVAVIGASRSPEKVGSIILKNIQESGYKGKVYPVNPSMEYKDMASLPEIPDLAIVAIPAPAVIETLDQIGQKSTKNVVVITAGFKEAGSADLEKQLIEVARKYDLKILGPNCLGFVNTNCPINATFGPKISGTGNLRFISQSGALATSLFDWCATSGLGFNEFVTLGNKAVLNENHFLEYYLKDPTQPIGLYLESISNGVEFVKISSQLTKKIPIFILKPGKSQQAARAMQSHTGAIAGEDAILEAALKQAGIIRCDTMQEFFDLARAVSWSKALAGPKVAVISNAGGPAVVCADAIAASGLQLAEFDADTHQKLLQILPRSAAVGDPVDVLGDALSDLYSQAAEIILAGNQTDALVILLTPQLMTQIDKTAELVGSLAQKFNKPIFCSFIGGNTIVSGERILNKFKIPSFDYPEQAIKALSQVWWWQSQKNVSPDSPVSFQFDTERIKETNDPQKLLTIAGISIPPSEITNSIPLDFLKKYGSPVVLKLPNLLHKTEIGGVITDINTEIELSAAWERLRVQGAAIQVQKQVEKGIEVIVGVKKDPTFGLVLLFGAGGKLAELIDDRNLLLLPVTKDQVVKLVQGSKVAKLLNGFRGESPYALEKLYDLILRLACLGKEIEINPVIVTKTDAWAVDPKTVNSGPAFKSAKTLSHDVLASKFHYFVFEPDVPLTYKPGQYISVKVADSRINAYSIASDEGSSKFGLLVDISPGGQGSKYFENLKAGDTISFLGPFGIFVYKDDAAEQLVFLGTGSGNSCLKRIIDYALKEARYTKPITLYMGLRFPEDVFWKDYFENLAKEHANFHFKLCLSKPDESWKGYCGHVTDVFNQDFSDASKISAYICGNEPMIDEATQILATKGCPKERIYSEKFF